MNKGWPMIARLFKSLSFSIKAGIGGIIGTVEDDRQLFNELEMMIAQNGIMNKELDYLLENYPMIRDSWREIHDTTCTEYGMTSDGEKIEEVTKAV